MTSGTRFTDKVALVTGAGRGIGRATVLALAREGAKVAINDVDVVAAREVRREVEALGRQGLACAGNVADRAAAQSVVGEVIAAFGSINILVNNAAVMTAGTIATTREQDWDEAIAVDLTGVFHCLQAVAPVFIQRAERNPEARCNGKVVNVTSVMGLRGTVGRIGYAAAKAGVIGLTMSAAREWGRYRVNVNAVAFGIVETRMTEGVRADPRLTETYLQQIPLGYYLSPDQAAATVLFLCSADADYVTGHVLNVSGGMHIGF